MDIELIMDVLNKHGITNIALAEDIHTLAKECYNDGRHDEAFWWSQQDGDDAWVGQFDLDTGEEIEPLALGDVPNINEIQAKQIENSDMSDAILSMFDDEVFVPPSQELLEAYERYKLMNIKIDLDKPLKDQDDDE